MIYFFFLRNSCHRVACRRSIATFETRCMSSQHCFQAGLINASNGNNPRSGNGRWLGDLYRITNQNQYMGGLRRGRR